MMDFKFLLVAGTPEDKMRLFLIYYITSQQPPSEVKLHTSLPVSLDCVGPLQPSVLYRWFVVGSPGVHFR